MIFPGDKNLKFFYERFLLMEAFSLHSPWLTLFSVLGHSKAEHTLAITMSSRSLVNHFAIHVNVERMCEIQAQHK